jgi:hypothetical protein
MSYACGGLLNVLYLLMLYVIYVFGFLGLPAVLHGVMDSNFKLFAFVINELIKGEIEKPSGQFLGLIVMSH